MKRNSSGAGSRRSDRSLMRLAAAFVSVGMILPEYLLLLVATAFLATTVQAIVQTMSGREIPTQAEVP